MNSNFDLKKLNCVELSDETAMAIDGGISHKTMAIGCLTTALCPVLGAGFWVGYFINS